MGLREGEGEGKLFSSSNATIVFVYNVPPFLLGLPKGTGVEGPGCHGNGDKTSRSQSERRTQKHASDPGRDLFCSLVRGDCAKGGGRKKGWMCGRKNPGVKEGLVWTS